MAGEAGSGAAGSSTIRISGSGAGSGSGTTRGAWHLGHFTVLPAASSRILSRAPQEQETGIVTLPATISRFPASFQPAAALYTDLTVARWEEITCG